jgi:phage-related protein
MTADKLEDETDNPEESVKPVFWIGSSLEDIRDFPDDVRLSMGFALWEAQQGRKHIDAKSLKGFGGAGVLEVVADEQGSTFRGLYTVKFTGAVYVLHVFQKKSKRGAKTPKHEMDLIHKRLRAAADHHKDWRSAQKKEKQNEKSKTDKGKKK